MRQGKTGLNFQGKKLSAGWSLIFQIRVPAKVFKVIP